MTRYLSIALLFGLGGCGGIIGELEKVPQGPDVSAAPWPRLVDTPEPPEARLTAGSGERALESLTNERTAQDSRQARADAVPPVSQTLVSRGQSNVLRTADAGPGVDADDLLARAALLRERTQASSQPISNDLEARSALIRERSNTAVVAAAPPNRPVPLRPLETPVVSSTFEERARKAQERAKQAGS